MSIQQKIYLYRYFEAIFLTQVEYSGSVTRQILTTAHYNFAYFSIKMYALGTSNEAVLMSTHSICF